MSEDETPGGGTGGGGGESGSEGGAQGGQQQDSGQGDGGGVQQDQGITYDLDYGMREGDRGGHERRDR